MMELPKQFNVRVYGILERGDEVLLSDEIKGGTKMTKFPGGGLEFGEGLADAVIREYQEELGIAVEVKEFLYINDFLQVSAFNKDDQLLSVYYKVNQVCTTPIETFNLPFEQLNAEDQCFRWVKKSELEEEWLTYPIDKIVSQILRNE
jgi:8-oxo-dGTP pyrophosphatase MutT (NUDIX family)